MNNLNDLLKGFEEMDATEEDKMAMLMGLLDVDRIAKDLQKTAALNRIGMAMIRPADELAYAVLRIYRPDLFETSAERIEA